MVVPLILYGCYNTSPWFKQARIGKGGKMFYILKFKTMRDIDTSVPFNVASSERTTRIGAFLRRNSLDEIPQLINVIQGDMSLIGPRPLLTRYYHLFDEFQDRRHQVRPGITGLVQVSGRNILPWQKRFELDVQYVSNYGLILDLCILIKTVWVLLSSSDIKTSEVPEEPYEV